MKKLLGIFTLAAYVLTSCGGNSNTEENAETQQLHNHDHDHGHDHDHDHDHDHHDHNHDHEGHSVFFVNLKDGDVIQSPIIVEMGVEGMEVKPAGEVVEGTGHHHLLINKNFIKEGEPVPADEQHIHYGQGQTKDTIKLAPGNYTLTLQFADGVHRSYGKAMSQSISVEVK